MLAVFTDLDGTLLDHRTYSFDAARPALEQLARCNFPVILCTSKTRAEVEVLRAALDNGHPFVVENGGGVFIPLNYFPFPVERAARRGAYNVLEYGASYQDLVRALHEASRLSGCPVRGFHEMSAEEIASCCDLPLEQARLAKQREYDEPFEVLAPRALKRLLETIEQLGKRWTRGGRFHHITGNNDKAGAVTALVRLFRRRYAGLTTVGLGDAPNDAEFLRVVDVAVAVRSAHTPRLLRMVGNARPTTLPGPAGWNEALLQMVPQ
jgi:mannosyl-3-phosphoglycerate phosphatase